MQEFADQIGAVRHSTCTNLFLERALTKKKGVSPPKYTFWDNFLYVTNTEDLDKLQQTTQFKIRHLWLMFLLLTTIPTCCLKTKNSVLYQMILDGHSALYQMIKGAS